jgi:hypothetical protein
MIAIFHENPPGTPLTVVAYIHIVNAGLIFLFFPLSFLFLLPSLKAIRDGNPYSFIHCLPGSLELALLSFV